MAQSKSGTNTASVAASTSSPTTYQVPSGISANCTAFLTSLDTDSQFTSCTAPLLKATDAFGPSSNATQSALVSALDTLCASPGCSDSYIRSQLVAFNAACRPELTGPNIAVLDTYDILYIMNPLKKAICSKDSGTYCVLKAPSSDPAPISSSSVSAGLAVANNFVSDSSDADIVAAAVAAFEKGGVVTPSKRRRAEAQSVVQYAPDTQVYRDNGVMYLYTLPNLSSASLCTNCTQQVLAAYAGWETAVPYAAGLTNSPMLGTQAQLWGQVSNKCGSAFVQKVQTAAGAAAGQVEANAGVASINFGMGSAVTGAFAVALSLLVAL